MRTTFIVFMIFLIACICALFAIELPKNRSKVISAELDRVEAGLGR